MEGWSLKNFSTKIRAQIVIAAGSVMTDPNIGPTVRMDNHHAAGVFLPKPATILKAPSAKYKTGRELAMAMMTTTKTGSV